MLFAFFDEQGRVREAHNDETVTELPAGAIELNDGQWGKRFDLRLVDGELVDSPEPAAAINDAKKRAITAINAACEQAIASIQSGYPASEVLSWPKQEAEARAYVDDPRAMTPLLNALADARGIDKAELVARVISKADAFALYSGAMIGKRQALEDALNALPADATEEQVAAIAW